MMGVFVTDFAPKANFGTNYVVPVVILKDISNIVFVKMQPSLVVSVILP